MRKTLFLICIVTASFLGAQNDLEDYQSPKNQFYWKNRKPFEGYWQQDVSYYIKAIVDDQTDVVSGDLELTYFNNSPDELTFVYFHLYNNAQTKDSYLSDLYRNNNYHLKYGKYRSQNLGTVVESITDDSKALVTETDNTVMKVYLNSPLKPGTATVFKIKFKTYFDSEAIRNRMKLFKSGKYKHYDMVHWYPRISVYDRKFGWDTEQHMDHEFYGDFGIYNVEITLPKQYILDGTGNLMNEKDVMPTDLRAKLDISNFKSKAFNSEPSELIVPDGTTKTWKFSATNVHDVAYTFDPTYRIGEVRWQGIRCIALAQESHAAGWQNAASYVAKIIETNSKNIGMYGYPKMIAADAQDGMEYPMLTLDGGFDPIYRGLFIHEISHNWFFGMVGSNETYRPMMDEGFTQFYSSDTWENIEGVWEMSYKSKSNYINKYTKPLRTKDAEAFLGYYNSAIKGEEHTLNTHGDGFNGAIRQGGGYGQVYTKTATMLYNLKYVLGDSLFVAAMQHYFNQWKMCHPYTEDFRNSIIQFTHVDLNWFFDQWIETSKTIDYSVKKIKRIKRTNDYLITFKRIGKMQMPLDFTVYSKDSSSKSFYIPNNWFVKKTSAMVLPRWIGWDKVKPYYTAKVTIPGGIQKVVIDTTNRLADINMINNSKKKNIHIGFDSKVWNYPDRTNYEIGVRPSIWFNGFDGIKVGAHANGNYFNYKHIFDATFWFNTGLAQAYQDTLGFNAFDLVSFLFNYKTPIDGFMKKSFFYTSLRELDGLSSAMLGIDKISNNDKDRFYFQLKTMIRDVEKDKDYLIYNDEWLSKKLNNQMIMGWEHSYKYRRGNGIINASLRSPFIFSDYDLTSLTFSVVNKNNLGWINFNTRLFGQHGLGKTIPYESQLYAAGANPEELMDNKYTRSMGFFEPFAFSDKTNHFASGGGLNLRGYMGYLLYQIDNNGISRYNYKGTSGAAFNAELEFDKLVGLGKPLFKSTLKVTPYLFGDIGLINNNSVNEVIKFTDPIMDAGAGLSISIQKWWKLTNIKPLTVRADFPLFINRLPFAEDEYLQFRWVIGVNRAF